MHGVSVGCLSPLPFFGTRKQCSCDLEWEIKKSGWILNNVPLKPEPHVGVLQTRGPVTKWAAPIQSGPFLTEVEKKAFITVNVNEF